MKEVSFFSSSKDHKQMDIVQRINGIHSFSLLFKQMAQSPQQLFLPLKNCNIKAKVSGKASGNTSFGQKFSLKAHRIKTCSPGN